MAKSAINEIKRFERNNSKGKVKCILTLDEIDDSYDWDGENGAERMFGSTYIHVDEHVDEIKQPVVGNSYYYEYSPAPYQIISVKSLDHFLKREKSKSNDDEEKKYIDNFVNELYESGVKYWVSLKLMPMDDDTDNWQY